MKLNIKNITFIAALAAVGFTGCKRGDDFYVSPNYPAEVTPGLLLTAIEVSTFNSYEGFLIKDASILVQQNAGIDGQMLPINIYVLAENEFDNQWAQNYQAMYACKDLQTRYGAANPYYSGIADIMMAMNVGQLADLWGDVPYSEALQGATNYQAKYDSQESVLQSILALLDDAITKLNMSADANELLPGSDDVAFGGDVTRWIKVAHTLKARYLLRFSNKSTFDPAAVLSNLTDGIQNTGEDFVTVHGTRNNEFNQWFDFQNNRQYYAMASEPFVDSMKLRPTDIRLYYYFDSTDIGDVVGSPIANPTSDGVSQWGSYLAGGPTVGVHIVSFTEVKFIEAEVKFRQGDAAGAATALNDAIMASCSMVTSGAYDGTDIATYTDANIDLSRIIYEKWIALFGSAEPYNDYRRTGFPALVPNPNGRLTVIPKRYPTPQNERVSNPNAPVPALTTPVWFAQ